MAINQYNSPVRTDYKDTYISQHVDLPYEAIAAKMARDQRDFDTAEGEVNARDWSDSLLVEDNEQSYQLSNNLESGLQQLIKDSNGDFRQAEEYLSNANSKWNKHLSSTSHKLAEENKINVYTQKESLNKSGGEIDQEMFNRDRKKYGDQGGAYEGNVFRNREIVGSHNWQKEFLEKGGLMKPDSEKSSGSTPSLDGKTQTSWTKDNKSLTGEDWADFMRGAAKGNDKFQLLLDYEVELLSESNPEDFDTQEEIDKFREQRTDEYISDSAEALAYNQKSKTYTKENLGGGGNGNDDDEKTANSAVYKFMTDPNKKSFISSLKDLNSNSYALANKEKLQNSFYKKESGKAGQKQLQTGIFAENPLESSRKFNDAVNELFNTDLSDGDRAEPEQLSAINALFAGDLDKLPGELKSLLDGVSPQYKDRFIKDQKREFELSLKTKDNIDLANQQLAKKGLMSKNAANFYTNVGRYDLAIQKFNSELNKIPKDQLTEEQVAENEEIKKAIEEYKIVKELSKRKFSLRKDLTVSEEGFGSYLDMSEYSNEDGIMKKKVDTFVKYFGGKIGEGLGNTKVLRYSDSYSNGKLNLYSKTPNGGRNMQGYSFPDSLSEYLPKNGAGGVLSSQFMNEIGEYAYLEPATDSFKDEYNQALNDRKTADLSSVQQTGIKEGDEKMFSYSSTPANQESKKRNEDFRYFIENLSVTSSVNNSEGNKETIKMKDLVQRELEKTEGYDEMTLTEKQKQEKVMLGKLYGAPLIKLNLKDGGLTIHYGGSTNGWDLDIAKNGSEMPNGTTSDGTMITDYFKGDSDKYLSAYSRALDDEVSQGVYRFGEKYKMQREVDESGSSRIVTYKKTESSSETGDSWQIVDDNEALNLKKLMGGISYLVDVDGDKATIEAYNEELGENYTTIEEIKNDIVEAYYKNK